METREGEKTKTSVCVHISLSNEYPIALCLSKWPLQKSKWVFEEALPDTDQKEHNAVEDEPAKYSW